MADQTKYLLNEKDIPQHDKVKAVLKGQKRFRFFGTLFDGKLVFLSVQSQFR